MEQHKERHELNHTGETPYSCRFCDRKFSWENSKVIHEKTHTGEKAFTCRFCDKHFTLLIYKKRHENRKHSTCLW